MAYQLHVKNKDAIYANIEGKNLMDVLSVRANVVPKGCHNGACGVCRVKVLSGEFENLGMNRKLITEEDEANSIFLACRLKVKSDMELEFIPKKKKSSVYVLGD
jgi:ferredoxin